MLKKVRAVLGGKAVGVSPAGFARFLHREDPYVSTESPTSGAGEGKAAAEGRKSSEAGEVARENKCH